MISHNDIINPKKLHIFSVVATLRNITKASRELNLSQPAVSNSLSSLESFYNIKIYHVQGRQVHITEAGKRLLAHWHKIESQLLAMNEEMYDIEHGKTGKVTLAMVSTAKYFLSPLLKAFSKQGVDIDCTIVNRAQINQQLLDFQADIGLLTEPPYHPDIQAKRLGPNRLVLICHPSHNLAKKQQVSFSDIANEVFVTREHSAQISQNLYKLFRENNADLHSHITINSTEAVKAGVLDKLGIALMPELAVRYELNNNRLVALNYHSDRLINHWYLVTRNTQTISPLTQSFIDETVNLFGWDT